MPHDTVSSRLNAGAQNQPCEEKREYPSDIIPHGWKEKIASLHRSYPLSPDWLADPSPCHTMAIFIEDALPFLPII